MKTYFIGDVHGCADELTELLEKINPNPEDRIIFLGDLINRGPDSLAALKLAKSIGAETLAGNHELGFVRYIESGNLSADNVHFEKVRKQLDSEIETWIHWIKTWPLFLESSDWIAIHAGLPPNTAVSETDPRILTRIRTWDGRGENLSDKTNPPWHDFYKGPKHIIYGHWAIQGFHQTAFTTCLDTGCVWGGSLTAMSWPDREIYQVKARKTYLTIGNH